MLKRVKASSPYETVEDNTEEDANPNGISDEPDEAELVKDGDGWPLPFKKTN